MKNKVTAIFLLVMMVFAMTGCTSDEIGYLELMKDYTDLSGVGLSETIVIDYDGSMDDELGWQLGAQHLEIRLTGDVDQKNMTMDIAVAYRLASRGDFAPLSRLVMTKDSVIFSTEGIWNLYKTSASEAKQWSEEFINEVDAFVAANPYIAERLDSDEISWNKAALQNLNQIYDSLITNHESFESAIITAKDGGYELVLTKDSLLTLISNWLDFAVANSDKSYQLANDFIDYFQTFYNAADDEFALSKEMWQEALISIQGDWQRLSDQLKTMEIGANDRYVESIKMTGTEGNRVYTNKGQSIIEELGLKMTVNAVAAEKKVTIGSDITKAVTMQLFSDGLQEIIDRYTEFEQIVLMPDGMGFADVEVNGLFCGEATQNYSSAFMTTIDGSYAVSVKELFSLLNGISYQLNEGIVTVSNAEKDVTLATYDVDGIDYIKCRDLNQLGFNVVYEANPERITISQ